MEQIVTFKYQCMGNDYLVYDPNRNPTVLSPSGIARLCDRHFGIGADGVLVGPYLDREKMYVRIYNADGSEAARSGNGMAIFARYLKDQGYVQKTTFSFDTDAGEEHVVYLNEEGTRLKVSMGQPSFVIPYDKVMPFLTKDAKSVITPMLEIEKKENKK